jgi:Eukaryotic cytochrome b561
MFDFLISWLISPIDPVRLHLVDKSIAWHGRFMVAAWGFIFPMGIIIARFFKIFPNQKWQDQIDRKFWWYSHLTLQYTGGVLMLAGAGFIFSRGQTAELSHIHALFGYSVLVLGIAQFLAGWFRGTKGGPTEQVTRGDHYDMTLHRRIFEHFHKTMGYTALLLGFAAILSGLSMANAPRWMLLSILIWWLLMAIAFIRLQSLGRAIDTYQAIWGPSITHPGNKRKSMGWGMRRLPADNREKP